uniref:Synuclein, alpha interacting protein n=1 Tax=Cyprinus carpio carpio TaxID=630221 RepID=A0A9J8B040_CYPCA
EGWLWCVSAPSINWARGAASGGAGIKPTGIADVYSKFRPVKRVSPLKHQPQESDPESEGKSAEASKSRGLPLFGELEHYDLDMDEILDVPYIKSEKRSAATKALKPDLRKPKPVDQDRLRAQSAHGSEPDALLSDKADGGPSAFPLPPAKGPKQDKPWRTLGEADEETKKTQNILNIVREGQISLLNGHLECVRWMVSETEAIAELSCTREHPSLIHYAARHGQERVLLWLLQFMQEQAISLDEADQNGNTAVHVAAQFGHLSCVQTLVEYGSNVTVQNQQGERPSQSAERQGHSTCSRYLVVVETCMSLASQVVKLTKQLHEQTTARVALQNQLHLLLQTHEPSSHVESWPEMMLTAEAAPDDGQWTLKQRHMDSDGVLRSLAGEAEPGAGPMRRLGPGERRELKLARLKQIMQRSLSESDAEESKPPRPERPTQLSIAEPDENKHKFSLTHRTPKSVDVCSPSPSSDHSDPETKPEELPDGQKLTTSPKSALKSPSSRRKTSQNLKLRVTFDEPPRKDGPVPDAKVQPSKRAFGTFRSIMETLSGNQNSNNNNTPKHLHEFLFCFPLQKTSLTEKTFTGNPK